MLAMINEILVKLTLTGFQLAYRGIWREDVNSFPKGREIEPFVLSILDVKTVRNI